MASAPDSMCLIGIFPCIVVVYKKQNVYSSTGQQTLCRLDLLKRFVCKPQPTVSVDKRFNKSRFTKVFADLSRSKHLLFASWQWISIVDFSIFVICLINLNKCLCIFITSVAVWFGNFRILKFQLVIIDMFTVILVQCVDQSTYQSSIHSSIHPPQNYI